MIWIPKADDEYLSQKVLVSIPEDFTIVSGAPDNSVSKFENIARNRRQIIKKFMESDEPFLKMQDSCVKHLYPNNFADMEDFLKANPEWGGVALNPFGHDLLRLDKSHISLRCVLICREAVKNIKLDIVGSECDCLVFGREIRKNWKYGYLELNHSRISCFK